MQIVSWFDCTYKIYFITVSTWKICTILHNLILLLILSWLIQCKYSIWLILLCKTWEKIQQNVFNHHGLVHKNLAPRPEWIFQHLCHPTKKRTKKKINQLTFWPKNKKTYCFQFLWSEKEFQYHSQWYHQNHEKWEGQSNGWILHCP